MQDLIEDVDSFSHLSTLGLRLVEGESPVDIHLVWVWALTCVPFAAKSHSHASSSLSEQQSLRTKVASLAYLSLEFLWFWLFLTMVLAPLTFKKDICFSFLVLNALPGILVFLICVCVWLSCATDGILVPNQGWKLGPLAVKSQVL